MDTIILKIRSEGKVTVTRKWHMTLRYPKMHPHTKFGIPNSKNIRAVILFAILGSYLFLQIWENILLKLGK